MTRVPDYQAQLAALVFLLGLSGMAFSLAVAREPRLQAAMLIRLALAWYFAGFVGTHCLDWALR